MIQTIHFDSIDACIDYASQPLSNPDINRPSNYKLEQGTAYDKNWTHSANYAEAAEKARKGWPEGLAKVKPFAERLHGKLASRLQREVYDPAIQGLFFDVGLVVTGEPECWLEQNHAEQVGAAGNKVVTLSVAISASAYASALSLEQRGATVMALVQLLEAAGKSVKVVAVLGSKWSGNTANATLVLKQASEPLNADQLAFWLVSPDALRRLAFAVREVLTDGRIIRHSMGCQSACQHIPDADIKVNRLDEDNYRHGLNEAGFEKQLIEWLALVGIHIEK